MAIAVRVQDAKGEQVTTMKDDLISRQAAIDTCMREDVRTGYDGACLIAQLPSAQPERKKGKWTIEDCHAATYPYCCSNCTAHHRARYDFCPTCGADMRGERAPLPDDDSIYG